MKDFKPPINTRTTDDLLMIAAAPDNWQPEVVEMAKEELRYSRYLSHGSWKKMVTSGKPGSKE